MFNFVNQTHAQAKGGTVDNLQASCFDVTADDKKVHLLYGRLQDKDKPLELFWTQMQGANQNWSDPVQIPTTHAPPGTHHRGNDPQIAARGNRLMALWTAKGGGIYGSGPIGVALSDDGGRTWHPGPSPTSTANRDDVGYRFPATAADEHSFHVVWIHAAEKERSLRYARLDFGSKEWTKPVIIDSTACACCWNELKVQSDGKLLVLYRDDEPKDMALATSEDNGKSWRQITHVGQFDWKLNGCPHVGGGLALGKNDATGEAALFATVWTGEISHTGAFVLNSTDNGLSWSGLNKLGIAGDTGRHTDVAALSTTHAAVVWDQQSEDEQMVFTTMTANGGKTWGTAKQISESNRKANHPRLIGYDGRFLAFWSEEDTSQTPRIRIKAVNF